MPPNIDFFLVNKAYISNGHVIQEKPLITLPPITLFAFKIITITCWPSATTILGFTVPIYLTILGLAAMYMYKSERAPQLTPPKIEEFTKDQNRNKETPQFIP